MGAIVKGLTRRRLLLVRCDSERWVGRGPLRVTRPTLLE
jgi:hypothetical protein